MLQRQELIGGKIGADGNVSGASKSRDHRYFYFDGKRVGNVGNDGVEREDYAQQLARNTTAQSPDDKYRKFTPTNSADFDENYQPINAGFPGPAPGSYTVRAGDTLESIARALWGDAQLWYLLAEANGLDGQPSAPLTPNTVLQVPNKVTNLHNTSSTFRPYDPGKAMGDTSPTLPDPLPAPRGKDGGCGGIGKILTVVVAVVVAAFTQQWYLVNVGGYSGIAAAVSSGAWGTLAVSGAVGGVAGSVAGQTVGVATGVQDQFSWKGVVQGALQGGLSAGLGGWFQSGGLGSTLAASGNWGSAARHVASNIATQGLSIATGLQKGFDWRGVAASAASGYVSAWARPMLATTFGPVGGEIATRMASGIVGTAVRGGSVSRSLPGIIGDAVGATVGNALGDSIAAATEQGGGMTRGEAEERSAAREVYAMGDGIPRVNGLDFSQDAAARRAGIDPAGLPTYVGSDDPAFAYDYRNGSDIASDNYNGSRRTATVRSGQGLLAALADLGLNSAQQQAGYGYLLKSGQVQVGRNGVPMVQPGQELHIDLDDMSQAGLAGRAIAQESSMRADRATAAAQAATDSYAEAEIRRFANPPPSLVGGTAADFAYGAGGGRGFTNPASAGLSTAERAGLIALGGKDAAMGAVEAAGYSYGVVGTPETRAAWAIQTVDAGIAGMRKFFSDPKGSASGWWSDLNSNDPQAVREASAVGSGVMLGVGGGVVAGRLVAPGRPMSFSGAGLTKYELASEAAYADIRALHMTDIESFAQNTGLTAADATTLKKHLFFGRHEYPVDGSTVVRQRFTATHEIAYAWKTATEGELNPGQQAWIRQLADHELGERSFMAQGIPYKRQEAWNGSSFGSVPPGAHDLAPRAPNMTFPGYREPSSFWSWRD